MAERELSEDEYRAEVHRLGLRPTGVATAMTEVYRTPFGDFTSLNRPGTLSPADRYEHIERLKRRLGITLPLYRGPAA